MFIETKDSKRILWAISLCLALLVWAVFGQSLQYEFINFDDPGYIFENSIVRQGLTLQSVQWVFTHAHLGNWHPVTSLTNLLDVQLYGMNAGGHHATNVLLHMATVIALFLVLRNMTGSLWRSALVAALFAIHPLRVESVAWISERKDVLSGLFFVLTIGAYVRYVRLPFLAKRYGIVAGLFLLGLMSKSMLVTLPCVLLLLDFWPLNRFSDPSLKRAGKLIVEKVPLFLLALIFSVVSMQTQHATVESGQNIPPLYRLGNMICSYGTYVSQLFRPTNLALYYPYPPQIEIIHVLKNSVILSFLSWFVWSQRKKRPFMLVGWLWYVGMLVPVIGWVQVGIQAHADRYTYLPHIGLLVMIAWLIPVRWVAKKEGQYALGIIACCIIVTLSVFAHRQTSVWKNSQMVWEHSLSCTRDNFVACANLAREFQDQGRLDRSIEMYYRGIAASQDPRLYNMLGGVYEEKGMIDEALAQYENALDIKPNMAEALYSKGNALLRQSRTDEAFSCYQLAMAASPDDVRVPVHIGDQLAKQGLRKEAILYYEKAVEMQPENAHALVNIGGLWLTLGKPDQAAIYFTKALQINPRQPGIYNYIGNGFLEQKQYQKALKFFKQALVFRPDFPAAQEGLQKAQDGLMQQEGSALELEQ